jgi:hypothetical protein
MLRLILISLAIAALMLAPGIAYDMDRHFPGEGILRIPATGLDYMAVFFHELGHTALRWAFGQPAIPTFDWQDGGGMTYAYDRSWPLQGLVWVFMAAGLGWLWKNGGRGLFYIVSGVFIFLFALSFSEEKSDMLAVYMGHGAEIMIACFCILRALTNTVEGDKVVERWLNMVFGLYTLGRNIVMCRNLYSDVGQMAYDMQKGEHVQGDFRRLAELMNVKIETVAGLSLGFMIVMLALTGLLAWHLRDETD